VADDGVESCTSQEGCNCASCRSCRKGGVLVPGLWGPATLISARPFISGFGATPENGAPTQNAVQFPSVSGDAGGMLSGGFESRTGNSMISDRSNIDRAKASMMLLPKAMAALRRFQRAIAERALRKEADVLEVERGVLVERVFDFYDPTTQKIRLRKINEENIHTRKFAQARSMRQDMRQDVETNTPLGVEDLAEYALVDADLPTASSGSGVVRFMSSDSDTESDSSSSGARQQRRRPKNAAEFSSVSHSQAEVLTLWGVLVGKLLKAKVLNFTCVTDAAVMKRKLEVGKSDGTDRIMDSVRSRADMVVAQMRLLIRKIAKEPEDMLDTEWEDNNLLSELFSSEYVDTLYLITNAAGKIIGAQPVLVKASVPCRIFGDTHGQLRDVLMLFHAFGAPAADKDVCFVFNGDFVDRGKHQLALVGLLFALKVSMPDKIFLVRGNHEEKSMNSKYGFAAECFSSLGQDFGFRILSLMQKVFDVLPLGCLVGEKILVVHGGLGDARWGLAELMNVRRPLRHEDLNNEDNDWINSILWSDPIEDDNQDGDAKVFGVHASPRGKVAKQFGWDVTKVFCARNGLSLIVRSHQSKRGSPGFDVMHDSLLMRVFSARDYEGHSNDGATLFVRKHEDPDAGEAHFDADGFVRPKEKVNVLWVRPQVLRSCTKARKDAIRLNRIPGDTSPPRSPRQEKSPRRSRNSTGKSTVSTRQEPAKMEPASSRSSSQSTSSRASSQVPLLESVGTLLSAKPVGKAAAKKAAAAKKITRSGETTSPRARAPSC